MIQKYFQNAMQAAHYEMLEDQVGFYGSIPGAAGVWATGSTLEECRSELLEVLEEWVLLGIAMGHELPEFDGAILIQFGQILCCAIGDCENNLASNWHTAVFS
jgi:predicted RNase H-like HicB family nuclease